MSCVKRFSLKCGKQEAFVCEGLGQLDRCVRERNVSPEIAKYPGFHALKHRIFTNLRVFDLFLGELIEFGSKLVRNLLGSDIARGVTHLADLAVWQLLFLATALFFSLAAQPKAHEKFVTPPARV